MSLWYQYIIWVRSQRCGLFCYLVLLSIVKKQVTRQLHLCDLTHMNTLIPHPVTSEHRWLVKAPRGIHSVPEVSGRQLWHDYGISMMSQTRPVCKHRFFALPIDKTLSVEAQIELLWHSFVHLATGCGINMKDPSRLDSDWWIPHLRWCQNHDWANDLTGFSRHPSAGFTDLNPAPLSLLL